MSRETLTIQVDHVTRIEGHGSIRVHTKDGRVEDLKLSITEAGRFFEHFTKGMLPHEVPWIAGRICGICCVGHQLAATKAVEAALGLAVSPQTLALRRALNESQILQSHILHVFFLAVPDYLGAPSVLPLIQTHPDLVKRALKLKRLANDYTTALGGRALHPMANTLRGWRRLPEIRDLEAIRDGLVAALPDLEATLEAAAALPMPDYERETEYVSLRHPDEYALYDGDIYSSDTGGTVPVSDYRQVTNEFVVPHSTAKWARWHRESYAVGALARVNNNFAQLHPRAREAAGALGLQVPCHNPYKNNLAQVVEIVHCAHHGIERLDGILDRGLQPEDISYTPGPGQGCGAVEVPRGVLFHEYRFDEEGRCAAANAVIPTSQNLNNIERDMAAFVPRMLGTLSKDDIQLHLEMLLRAYDPCISCAVHLLDVEFCD